MCTFAGSANPSDNRAAFQGTRVRQGRAVYREKLDTPAGRADLAALKELDREGVVAVLCVERDEARCHRRVVIDALG